MNQGRGGVPARPKIYHIVHMDRLRPITAVGDLLCDGEVRRRIREGERLGTSIGALHIKDRRLRELQLSSHPGLFVGECVPFYFCPRSVTLHAIHRRRSYLAYQGGQDPIVHLEADLYDSVAWAEEKGWRWAFTTSSAASYRFTDHNSLDKLGEIHWDAVWATQWIGVREKKQAEFLVERQFPWHLVERIGVQNERTLAEASRIIAGSSHSPPVVKLPGWYF